MKQILYFDLIQLVMYEMEKKKKYNHAWTNHFTLELLRKLTLYQTTIL